MATLCEVRLKELENLNILRTTNNAKFLPTNSLAPTVCLCHTVPAGPMLQCELCHDAYHSGCVPGYQDTQAGQPWLCPLCSRSEKPPLDKVLPLLASLQRIRVRLPEGDALRFMIERTVRWQHRVQQVSPFTQQFNGKVCFVLVFLLLCFCACFWHFLYLVILHLVSKDETFLWKTFFCIPGWE